jgi:hypothetical protein
VASGEHLATKVKDTTIKISSLDKSSISKLLENFMTKNNTSKSPAVLWWLSAFTILNLGIAFCVSQYLGRQTFASILSFDVQDPPGPLEPRLYTQTAPLGKHYFGDFFQILQMSKLPSPYVSLNDYLISQYPPVGHWLLYPLTLLETRTAVLVFIFFAIALAIWSMWTLSQVLQPEIRALFVTLTLLSGPVLSVIDRGNLTIIIFAGVVAILFSKMSNFSRNVLQIVIICMKFFPIIYVFEFEMHDKKQWTKKNLVVKISFVIVMTSVGFLFLNGGVKENLWGFFEAYLSQGNAGGQLKTGGVSIVAFFEGMQSILGIEIKPVFLIGTKLILLVTLLVFLLAQYVGRISKLSNLQERFIVLTSCFCLLPTVVGMYQLIFLLIPLVIHIEKDSKEGTVSFSTLLLFLLVLPIRYDVANSVYLNSLVFSPLLILLLLHTLKNQWVRMRLSNVS